MSLRHRCALAVGVASAFLVILFPERTARAAITRDDIFLVEDVDGSLAEAGGNPSGYLAAVACRMRQQYPGSDRFDAIFVFSGIPLGGPMNVQQGWPVMSKVRGVGREPLYDSSKSFCSNHRLRQAVKMGDLAKLPADPEKPYRGDILSLGYALSGIELMAHEFGHQWLAAVNFDKGDGTGKHCHMRGYSGTGEKPPDNIETCDGWSLMDYNQHWSYLYNSHSVMYGNMIEDLGGGSFRFYYDKPKFSEMDQYLMGLRLAEEVPPQFVVLKDEQNLSPQPPTNNEWVMEGGIRMDFTVKDVIRAQGVRDPEREPCHWKGAMVFVWSRQEGLGPATVVLDKLVVYGNRWETFYDWATDGRGSFDMTRDGRGRGTGTCPSPNAPPPGDEGGGPDAAEAVDEPDVPDEPDEPDAVVVDVIAGDGGGEIPAADTGGGTETGELIDVSPTSDEGTAADGPRTDRTGTVDTPESDRVFVDGAGGNCVPGLLACDGAQVLRCVADGASWEYVRTCADEGLVCQGDGICTAPARKGGGCSGGEHAGTSWPGSLLAVVALLVLGRRREPGPHNVS